MNDLAYLTTQAELDEAARWNQERARHSHPTPPSDLGAYLAGPNTVAVTLLLALWSAWFDSEHKRIQLVLDAAREKRRQELEEAF